MQLQLPFFGVGVRPSRQVGGGYLEEASLPKELGGRYLEDARLPMEQEPGCVLDRTRTQEWAERMGLFRCCGRKLARES